MPPARAPHSPRRTNDQQWTDVPGLGRVPNGPRAHHRPMDRGIQFYDSYRQSHGYGRRRGGDRRGGSREDDQFRIRASLDSSRRSQRDKTTSRTAFGEPMPEFHNPIQFLAEGFARRQRELREEANRPDSHSERGYPERPRFRNRVWIRPNDNNDPREHHSNDASSDGEPQIKEEPSDDTSLPASGNEPLLPPKNHGSTPPTSSTPAVDPDRDADPASRPTEPSQTPEDEPGAPPASMPPPSNGPKVCTCPIGFECEAKENGLIDCRTLVSEHEWRNWKKGFDDDYQPELPPDVEPTEEPFATLQEVRAIIKMLDDVAKRRRRSMILRVTYSRMRDWVRKMQHNSITQETLTQSRVPDHLKAFLSENNQRLREAKECPEEIVEDLTILYRKWEFGDLSVLPRRGLIRGGPVRYLPDPNWEFKRSWDFFGHGHLVNGQTWSSRAELMRDGVHGPPIAGICGTIKQGAKSIVMGRHDDKNKDYYANVDQGETIWYYGTALGREDDDEEATNLMDQDTYRAERVTKSTKGQGPTNATKALFESYRTGRPVRVIRSFRLAKIVPWRPATGFRYDGLYIVKEPILDKKERQIYKFKMERMKEGQGPLRHANPPLQPERGLRKRKRGE